jgi:hypothetical protein
MASATATAISQASTAAPPGAAGGHPQARSGFQLAYDGSTKTVVLFGGSPTGTAGDAIADTWTWDAGGWRQLSPATSPPARSLGSMAYDERDRLVVLYGGAGQGGTPLTDTWTWDGQTWTERFPANNPSAAQESLMTFDPALNDVVLLKDEGGGFGRIVETWAWDGQDWAQLHPQTSPPGGSTLYSSLASPRSSGSLVLVPAETVDTPPPMWVFKNGNWSELLSPGGPSGRYWFSMGADDASGTIVLFGGESGHGVLSDTWLWDGQKWSQAHPATSPSGRDTGIAANLVYDAALGQSVLFGGTGPPRTILDDVWEWNGTDWTPRG